MGISSVNHSLEHRLNLPYKNHLGNYYYLYVGVFALFSLNIFPTNLLMALAVAIFLFSPLENTTYIYIFSLPWMYVAKFSFGLTLSLIQSVLFFIKLLLDKKYMKFSAYEQVYLLFLIFYGVLNVLNFHTLTGISFVLYFSISCFFISKYFLNDSTRKLFWELALYSVVLSNSFAAIYGYTNNTAHMRWISGMGYVSQLYGTMGTTRFGIYLCIGLLYGLFCLDKKWLKITVLVVLSAGVLATVSITAIALMIGMYVFYYITEKASIKKIGTFFLIAVIIGIIIIFWQNISQIQLIKPIALRVETIVNEAISGDIGAATTGRSELYDQYIDRYNNSSLLNRIFGFSRLIPEGIKYSHNSFVDMMNYFGIFGIILTSILQLKRLSDYRHYSDFKMYILLKITILLPAATVSIFSAQFWQIWLFI